MQIAGVFAIFVAVGHGWLGDKNLRAQPLQPPVRNFIRTAYQFGTAGWFASGVILLYSVGFSEATRHLLAIVFIALFAFGAIVNAWFTKGRHAGWVLLAVICILLGVELYLP